jgi:mannosyltransferase
VSPWKYNRQFHRLSKIRGAAVYYESLGLGEAHILAQRDDFVMTTAPNNSAGEPSDSIRSPFPWVWLAALTILAAGLRVVGLNKGLWLDEIAFLVTTVRHPLAEIITVFPGDTQHPLYSILARLSILAFGEHIWSLRLPAMVFGVATVPALYFLAESVASRTEALLCAAFLTVSYHHVWFSQNARGYSALAFWTILATYFLLRGIRSGRRGPYAGYAIAASLGAYTHLAMMFLIASHVLIAAGSALSDWKRGESLQKWKLPLQAFVLAGGLTLVLYAPIVVQVQKFFLKGPSGMKVVSTPNWALLEAIRGLTVGLGAGGVLVAAALVVVCGAWSYFKQDRMVFAFLVLPGILTVGSVAVRGTMYPRFFFSLIGFAIMIIVRGMIVIPRSIGEFFGRSSPGLRRRLAPALTAVLAAMFFVSSAFSLVNNYRYPKQDFDGAIRFAEEESRNGATVVTAGAAIYPLKEYYTKPWDDVESVEKMREICRKGQPVFVIYTMPRYLQVVAPGVLAMIRREFTMVRVFHGTLGDGDIFVARFDPRNVTLPRT